MSTGTVTDEQRTVLFEPIAGFYSVIFPLIWRIGFPGLHRWVRRQLVGHRRILDAGTGPGYWARFIARAEPREQVIGLDLSESFLARARAATSKQAVLYVCGDLTAAPFADQSFDAVICSGVLDTLPDPQAALREFARVLRPGGRVLLVLRGGPAVISTSMEVCFRLVVGFARAYRERALRHVLVPRRLWSRKPIFALLPELAGHAGLSLVGRQRGAFAARALLERPGLTRSEPREQTER